MSTVNLERLPAPRLLDDTPYEALLNERLDSLRDALTTLGQDYDLPLPSDPAYQILAVEAYRELTRRHHINDVARSVLLATAVGADLDHLAALFNVARHVITPADPTAVPPVAEVLETDAALRLRTQQAFEGLSVAGPRGAYVFHGLSAHPQVADITAISPAPAEVLVTVLGTEGDGTPSTEVLDAVTAALGDDAVRPVADRLTVAPASIVPYTIEMGLTLSPGPEQEPVLVAAVDAVTAYAQAQRRLGRDVRRSALFAAAHVEGVRRVEMPEPAADVVMDPTQASLAQAITITVEGIADD